MKQTDVAIIGGGINGSSTGLELAKNGLNVTIIDKNFICRGASGVNAGTLTMHMTRAQLIPYAKKGWELWMNTSEWLSKEIDVEKKNGLCLAFTEDEEKLLIERSKIRKEYGADISIISIKEAKKIDPNINIYQGEYVPLNINEFDKNEKYLVFSGIGNHKTFISMLRKNNINIVKEIEFPDHYRYLQKEVEDIISMSEKLNCKVMTTEKDYMRLNRNDKISYIKSELKILNQETFINDISKVYENN